MRLLFLDDSFFKNSGILAYGGFCIPDHLVRELDTAILGVKIKHKVPPSVELKWSPPPDHYLRTRLKGPRHELYKDVVAALRSHSARVLCAVHSLNDCYGVKIHEWSREKASIWAAKQQLRFLAERFETNDLQVADDIGLIVSDRYGSRTGEESLIRDFSFDMIVGTDYNRLDRIVLPPLMADSKHTNMIQCADILVGIISSTLQNSKYGIALIEDVATQFVFNPHHRAVAFASMFSGAILGYGLKLFPAGFRPSGLKHLSDLDSKYIVTNEGVRPHPRANPAG